MSDTGIEETENETVTSLENLATTATVDREAMKILPLRKSKITTEIVYVNQNLVKTMERIEGLLKTCRGKKKMPKRAPIIF